MENRTNKGSYSVITAGSNQFSQPYQVSQPNLNPNPPYKIEHLKHLYCEGTGIDKHQLPQFGERCKTCGGTGWVDVKVENSERLVKCDICRGYGVVYDKSQYGTECQECHGTGQMHIKINTY